MYWKLLLEPCNSLCISFKMSLLNVAKFSNLEKYKRKQLILTQNNYVMNVLGTYNISTWYVTYMAHELFDTPRGMMANAY